MSGEAKKFDDGKPRYDLIPHEGLDAVARILAHGAETYGERNWEQGLKWGRIYAALMRHLWKWWSGEKIDSDSGMPHLWHAACNIFFLVVHEQRGIGEDDRVKVKHVFAHQLTGMICPKCGESFRGLQFSRKVNNQYFHAECADSLP